jgi:acyl-coenzyme A synthetase/AMP-(fatty) acid ligase
MRLLSYSRKREMQPSIPGDVILAYVANGIEFHIIMRAALELNCPFAPLNPKTVENAKETKHYLNVLKPAVVMVPDRVISQSIIQSAPTEIERAKILLVYDGVCVTERWKDICSFVKNTSGSNSAIDSLQVKRNTEDVVLILFTSGTTSLPKGVPHSNTSLATIFINTHEVMKLDSSRVSGNHAPLSHGLGIIFFGMFHFAGAKVVHPSGSYDAGAGLAAIREEGVADIPGVPAMISAMLEHPDFKIDRYQWVEVHCYGSYGYTARTFSTLHERTKSCGSNGRIWVVRVWACLDGPPDQTPDESYPLLGAMLRVCDPETGDVMSRGEAGELHLGGPQIITRYLLGESQDAEKANSCFMTIITDTGSRQKIEPSWPKTDSQRS